MRARATLAIAVMFAAVASTGCGGGKSGDVGGADALSSDRFDSDRAFGLIAAQVEVGQRPAGSPQLRGLARRLRARLPNGRFEPVGGGLRNIVGSLPGPPPATVVAAHYDTEAAPRGFVGANDGAAGTAAVIEIARALRHALPPRHREVRFVLFDGEEEPPGCPPPEFLDCALRGSKAYVQRHIGEIRSGRVGRLILLDYVANAGLSLPREGNSDPGLWAQLRAAADSVGAGERFPGGEQAPIADDHLPFIAEGVPSVDLIDFSYEHRDTVEDRLDKLDPAALDAVGEAVTALVVRLATQNPDAE